MAGYATPAWTNNAAPAIDAAALTDIGQGIEISEHPYAVCPTPSSTVNKLVTLDYSGTLTLFTGMMVRVKFTNRNGAANPALNVNGTGAIPIMAFGTVPAGINAWRDGEVVNLIYDGTNWLMAGGDTDIVVVSTTVSSLPVTISNDRITNTHVLLNWYMGTPEAQFSQWTVSTAGGSVTIAGTINGTTTLTMILGRAPSA